MQDWERTLALLREKGWSWAYVKCVDLEKGTDTFYASIRRGDESLVSLRPSLEEAVRALGLLAESSTAK